MLRLFKGIFAPFKHHNQDRSIVPVTQTDREYVTANPPAMCWDILRPGGAFMLTDNATGRSHIVDECSSPKIVRREEMGGILWEHNNKLFWPEAQPCKECNHVKNIWYIPCVGITFHDQAPNQVEEGFLMLRLGRLDRSKIQKGQYDS